MTLIQSLHSLRHVRHPKSSLYGKAKLQTRELAYLSTRDTLCRESHRRHGTVRVPVLRASYLPSTKASITGKLELKVATRKNEMHILKRKDKCGGVGRF
jgi:hypothetical protein